MLDEVVRLGDVLGELLLLLLVVRLGDRDRELLPLFVRDTVRRTALFSLSLGGMAAGSVVVDDPNNFPTSDVMI